MTQVVQEFLWAQKVQEPIALYSDWLVVGHVDEFMTFVPAPDRKVNAVLFQCAYNNIICCMHCMHDLKSRVLLSTLYPTMQCT